MSESASSDVRRRTHRSRRALAIHVANAAVPNRGFNRETSAVAGSLGIRIRSAQTARTRPWSTRLDRRLAFPF